MPAITASVTLRIPADVLERVDAARGDMSRNLWMVTALRMVVDSPAAGGWFSKGAVERALDRPEPEAVREQTSRSVPASAEQPEAEGVMEFDDRGRMTRFEGTYAPRPFSPYPKGGKR